MDFGDLEEFGFEKSNACAGRTCLRKENFKDADDAFNKGKKFWSKFA